MKFSAALIVFFFSIAHTRPAPELADGQVSNAPIDLYHNPDDDAKLKCGSKTYSGHDIYIAAQYGVNLKAAGETRGKREYPEEFEHNDSKGNDLKFDPKTCPENDKKRQSYPLKVGGRYDGGKNNKNAGDERVIYYNTGTFSEDGNPQVNYCGIITHSGAPTGGFLKC